MRCFKIELLATADGFNFAETQAEKREDTVTVVLWLENKKEAKVAAENIASALLRVTHVGNIEYIVQSIKAVRKKVSVVICT